MSEVVSNSDQSLSKIQTETFVCPNCGGTFKFDIKKQKFLCASCTHEAQIETVVDYITEHDFNDYYRREALCVPFEGFASVACQNCGCEIVFSENETATTCPMCGSTQIATVKQHSGIPPEGIIPFKIDKAEANLNFQKWVKSRWFAPNDFKKYSQEGKLAGQYIPFWTYDADVYATYVGEGGRTRTYQDSDGNTQTQTDWYHVSGAVSEYFDDIQVCASKINSDSVLNGVLPYDTIGSLLPYSQAYLSGFQAELYSIKADVGFETAKKIIYNKMESLARMDILRSYDSARVHSVNCHYSNVTYKHVLLPVWTSAFGYKGKTYHYAVNGETGKVNGKRPYSALKIFFAILLAVIVIGGIAFFASKNKHNSKKESHASIQSGVALNISESFFTASTYNINL